MNLLQVFIIFLLFNVVAGMFTHANIFGISPDIQYEGEYQNIATNPDISNISTDPYAEAEQYVKTWGVLSVLYDTLTFNWIYSYVPWDYRDNTIIIMLVNGINALLLIIGIATFWQIVRRIEFLAD